RLVHLDWPVEGRYVAQGLAVGFPVPSLHALDGGRPTESQRLTARAAVAAFLEVRPDLVLELPRGATESGRGWPSPRSWEAVAALLAACEGAGASEDARAALVAGAVGEGAALEFLSWLEHLDLPDPEAVLADPESFELPERSDRAFAAPTAVATGAVARGDADPGDRAGRRVAPGAAARRRPPRRANARREPAGRRRAAGGRARPRADPPRRRATAVKRARLEALPPELRRRFAAGRIWAAHRAPYLASALLALDPVVVESEDGDPPFDLAAFPADTRWRVYVDPDALAVTDVPELGFWLLHQTGHL